LFERSIAVFQKVLAHFRSEEILAVDHGGQAHKGVWGMSWRQKAMKGVEGCEKPGEAVKRALIPGFPNYRILNP
jgi:hypothetical protein